MNEIEDMIEEKKAKRAAIMSEKEIEEAEQFLVWYRRAYTDKNRLGLAGSRACRNKNFPTLPPSAAKRCDCGEQPATPDPPAAP